MKKLLCVLCALILTVPFAFAEEVDFSDMSQMEILDIINAGRNALYLEEAGDGLLRYDSGHGIIIIFNGISEGRNGRAELSVTIVNDTDTDYTVWSEDDSYVNGWRCNTTAVSEVNAHRRMNDTWRISISEANMSSINEIEDIELYITIYVTGAIRDRLVIPNPIILTFN